MISRRPRSEEHTSELQSPCNLVCRLLLEKKKKKEINVLDPRATMAFRQTWTVDPYPAPRGQGRLRSCHPPLPLLRSAFPLFFFFNDTATTEIYTLSLHDALPI